MSARHTIDRDALLERFRATDALRHAWLWNIEARRLLERLERELTQSGSTSDDSKHVLWLVVVRIRRYFLALASMSFQAEERTFFHAIDGYHAVHKSLFETYVEFALCTMYLELFGTSGDPNGLTLRERLRLHAQTTSLKKNRQHRFREPAWREMQDKAAASGFSFQAPPSTKALMDEPLDDVTQRLKALIERLQGPKVGIAQYRHWFPERDMQGQFFVAVDEDASTRPRNCGSLEWLCKAVMARHSPDLKHRDWWVSAYNNDYDLINMYTHPAMGYDDCYRGTAERSLDLAQMQMSMRWVFHEVVLPPMRMYFRDVWLDFVEEEERLSRLHNNTSRVVLAFLHHVHQQDRETSPDGPNLWA